MKTAKFKLSDLQEPAPAKRAAPKPKVSWINDFLRKRDKLLKELAADGVKKLR